MCNNNLTQDPRFSYIGDIGSAVTWLDSREAMRCAYLARLIEGTLPKGVDGAPLANNLAELREISVGAKSPYIHSKTALWERGRALDSTCLSRFSDADLQDFIARVEFADYLHEGKRCRHVSQVSWASLFSQGFDHSDIIDVMALFGFSARYTVAANDRFGCTSDPTQTCQPRAYYSCSHPLC